MATFISQSRYITIIVVRANNSGVLGYFITIRIDRFVANADIRDTSNFLIASKVSNKIIFANLNINDIVI
jgi:hypothetical protein